MEMESMTTAVRRLREAGYDSDFEALPDGRLRCSSCDSACDPDEVDIEEVVRFEGTSDPGDSSILVALRCETGHAGLFTSAYGADASPEAARFLRRLAREG